MGNYQDDVYKGHADFVNFWGQQIGTEGKPEPSTGKQFYVANVEFETTCIKASSGIDKHAGEIALKIAEFLVNKGIEAATEDAGELAVVFLKQAERMANPYLAPYVQELIEDIANWIGAGEDFDNFYALVCSDDHNPKGGHPILEWPDMGFNMPHDLYHYQYLSTKILPLNGDEVANYPLGQPGSGTNRTAKLPNMCVPLAPYGTPDEIKYHMANGSSYSLYYTGWDRDMGPDDKLWTVGVSAASMVDKWKLGPLNNWEQTKAQQWLTTVHKEEKAVYQHLITVEVIRPNGM